ncbi:hypothetical protein FSP39_010915 [Pinctada imbricata]|uniref:Glucose/Sorbosone dehydrogenase domain-containing protein n=1 Tax=Pinctada imbricata TaxID=66713 RepID=A0AA89BM31_PINIB|nr:hypothetical protein FSP39_010915 [Pinctada imbricata]
MEPKDMDYCFLDIKTNEKFMFGLPSNIGMETGASSSSSDCVCFKQLDGDTVKDGSRRLLVAWLPGIISMYYANGTMAKKPFFDIENYLDRRGYIDQITTFGLPSFALDPSFKNNGKLYASYSKMIQGKLIHRLSEYIMTSEIKPENTERILLEIEPPYKWHNLNDIFFGIDGYLYLFNGDGGVQGDQERLAQDGKTLFGKTLRIDVDSRSDSKEYGIPPDNPFIHNTSFAPEVFAYGFRNPWRCSQDPGDHVTGEGRGRIFCADVGYHGFEEINIVEKGGNYGWSGKKGFSCFEQDICNKMDNERFPIFAFDHEQRKSIIGGEVYRRNCIPHLKGKYLFADYFVE